MKNIGNIKNKNIDALLNSSNIYYEGGGKTLNNIIYPVGAVIIRVDSTNPATWYGGTWELLCPGRTLVCIDTSDGDFNTVKKTGGEKKHQLTKDELPPIDIRTNYATPDQDGGYGSGLQYGTTNGNSVNVLVKNINNGNKEHNNLQPYMVVYMWVRTA